MHVTGVSGKGFGIQHGWKHVVGVDDVAWCGGMWLGVGSCCSGWRHVTTYRGIWHGGWLGHVAGTEGMW